MDSRCVEQWIYVVFKRMVVVTVLVRRAKPARGSDTNDGVHRANRSMDVQLRILCNVVALSVYLAVSHTGRRSLQTS